MVKFNITYSLLFCLLALSAAGILVGCGSSDSESTAATMDVTQAYQTVEAKITQAIALTPTAQFTPSPTDTQAATATLTQTPLAGSPTISPQAPTGTYLASCDRVAPGNPIDVTIEDDTQMQPGQKFTKIWQLVNAGTCTWTREYKAIWFFGPKLGDVLTVPVPGNIAPGQSVQIAVDMVAPLSPDTYQSNWKLVNAKGEPFGIGPNGDLPFWVRIVVIPSTTATITFTVSPTETDSGGTPQSTQTPTPTPGIQVAGPAVLLPGDRYDLDTNQLNLASGEDITYQSDPSDNHLLNPQGLAVIGVYGSTEPNLQACLAASMSSVPIAVESISPGVYLCYRTDQGLSGWLRYNSYSSTDESLNVNILTWMQP